MYCWCKQMFWFFFLTEIILIIYMYMYICYTYTTGSSALPGIYAQARGHMHIYQAKHLSLWYKYNIRTVVSAIFFILH